MPEGTRHLSPPITKGAITLATSVVLNVFEPQMSRIQRGHTKYDASAILGFFEFK